MGGVDALVAKDATDLEDPLHPADHEPLQEQLGGNPQVHILLEGFVMGLKRPGQRPGRLTQQHRSLHLDVAAGLELAAQLADDAGARESHPA